MTRLRSWLGYSAAALTLMVAVLIPFALINLLTRAVASTGVQVDPVYTGGQADHVIDRGTYRVTVNRPVRPIGPLQRAQPYVQIAWSPASALPARVSDEIDIDKDGKPDALFTFDVPPNQKSPLRVEVIPRNAYVAAMHNVSRDSFSRIIARVHDQIIVRVPLAGPR